eukprot:673562-Amorphochlora_amoeboformis.AAC.1
MPLSSSGVRLQFLIYTQISSGSDIFAGNHNPALIVCSLIYRSLLPFSSWMPTALTSANPNPSPHVPWVDGNERGSEHRLGAQ